MATTPSPYDPSRPPSGYWYQRYWRYTNRPRAGCGCLYFALIFFVVCWHLSLLYPPFGWRYWYYGPVPDATSMRSSDTIHIAFIERRKGAGKINEHMIHQATGR
jgi:hypothetical protein